MNDLSVSRIRLLPQARSLLGGNLARKLMLRVLEKISTGSLTLRDGDETFHFGERGHPGEPQAEIVVHNREAYRKVLTGGTIASGEAYIEGDWSSPDPTEVTRLFSANMAAMETMEAKQHWYVRAGLAVAHAMNRNTHEGSRRNIAAHYDLSNELYALFLDDTMTYSAAYFTSPGDTLEQAQEAKYRRLAEKARIGPGDHVLEIGCGWGGFAIFAAGTYGCRVTGITLSEQQATLARQRVSEAGLDELVSIELIDYREVTGRFDRIVSIEMLEAVGHRYLDTFFAAIDRLLAPDGLAAVQVITIPEQRYESYKRRPDFIQRYIFPGGHLPSLEAMSGSMGRSGDLYVEEVDNIGVHYAETLRRWRERFLANVDQVHELGFDDRFVRMWEFYLAYCEGAFLARYISDLQVVLTRPMNGTLGTHPYGQQLVEVREADLPPRRGDLIVAQREAARARSEASA